MPNSVSTTSLPPKLFVSITSQPTLIRPAAAAWENIAPLVRASRPRTTSGRPADRAHAPSAAACRAAAQGEVVEAVNFNDPIQTVIAGTKAGVDKACEILKAAGAKRALRLPVSAPFHSSLMKPAAEKLREALAGVALAAPQIPVVNNVDVAVQQDADAIRDALYRQAFGPVRWVECVQALKARGITHLVECGPGKVLAGLTKRIDPELVGAALFDPATLAETRELLA